MNGAIQDWFLEVAEQHLDSVSLERGTHIKTYAELRQSSNRLANTLVEAGAQKGSLVGLFARDPLAVITGIIGALQVGTTFVPLDPHLPERRLVAMLQRITPNFLFVESEFLSQAMDLRRRLALNSQIIVDADAPSLQGFDILPVSPVSSPLSAGADFDSVCSIYFTSGSTGVPKAIAGKLKGIAHFIDWEVGALNVGPNDRVSQLTSPSFDGFLKDVFVPLCAGGTVCIPEDRNLAFDPAAIITWIEQCELTILHCVPSVMRALLNESLASDRLPSLRAVVLAGEAVFRADVERWFNLFGERVRLLNLYGPTETTLTKLYHFITPLDLEASRIQIGRPLPHTEALILGEDGGVCPIEAVGEIAIATEYSSHGYYGQPDLTGEKFVPHPLNSVDGGLIYKTGDYGRRLTDGSFEFYGRRDTQVKIRGVRIEVEEIEGLLLRYPSVKGAAVVQRDEANDSSLCACVIAQQPCQAAELRQFLAEFLPEYMLPTSYQFLESFPQTPNGKLDRAALAELATASTGSHKEAFCGGTEEVIAGLLADILGHDRFGRDHNFFTIGGHSLLAMRLLSRLHRNLGVEIPLGSFLIAPTVAHLAELVDQALLETRPESLNELLAAVESEQRSV
jgi:amino acid adenylation domain-containing protein